MKKLLASEPLHQLYKLPDSYVFSEASKRYYGSLTPQWDKLADINAIDFEIRLLGDVDGSELPYQNDINPHVFKPRFYTTDSATALRCIVPNREVLAHTLRSLFVSSSHLDHSQIIVSAVDHEESYAQHNAHWNIHDNVIVCQIPSFLNFLCNLWLLNHTVSRQTVAQLSHEFENRFKEPDARLIQELWSSIQEAHHLQPSDFEKAYNIQPQTSPSNRIAATNITIGTTDITLLQLTWGYDLSHAMLASAFARNPGIKNVVMLGGVGYLGQADISVDDIFVPEGLVRLQQGKATLQKLNNKILSTPNKIFTAKELDRGNLHTVIPTIGTMSHTALLSNAEYPVGAIDMEVEAFLDVLADYPHVSTYLLNYIMDMPSKGISLGDTYYNPTFAKKLFHDFNRGKYFCFEQALLSLASADDVYAS